MEMQVICFAKLVFFRFLLQPDPLHFCLRRFLLQQVEAQASALRQHEHQLTAIAGSLKESSAGHDKNLEIP